MARRAQARLPGLAVLFTSGYTENSIVHEGRLDPGVELLSKPYTRETLAQRVRQSLDKRSNIEAAQQIGGAPRSYQSELSVLLVEDESLVRMAGADMVTDLGHTVHEAWFRQRSAARS